MALDQGFTGDTSESSSSSGSDTDDQDTLDGGGVGSGTPGEGGHAVDPVSEQEQTEPTSDTSDDSTTDNSSTDTGDAASDSADSSGQLTDSPVATDDPASAGSGGEALDEASQAEQDGVGSDAPGGNSTGTDSGPGNESSQNIGDSGPGGGVSGSEPGTMARGGQPDDPQSGRNFTEDTEQTRDAQDLDPEDFDSPNQYVETAAERQFDSVDESEIYATQSGDRVEPRFTRAGARQAAASRIGVDPNQIELDDDPEGDGYTVEDVQGEVVEQREQLQQRRDVRQEIARGAAVSNVITRRQAARERAEQAQTDFQTGRLGDTRDIVRETVAEQAGDDVTPEDVQVQDVGGETEVRITGSPREEVVTQLEDETGIELSQSDVEFERVEREDGTAIRGELDSDAQRRYRQEQAPGQGTPFEGVFEAGAGAQYDFEQSTAPVEDTFNEVTPDTSGVEETFNRNTPDVPSSDDVLGLAAAGAPVAALEPTPAGEIGVAGLVAIGGSLAAAEGLRRASTSSGAGVATTEVEVPDAEGDVQQFRNELEITGSSQQFTTELEAPDKQQQDAGPFGVPELGITIDASGNNAPWEVNEQSVEDASDGLFTSEVDVPADGDADGDAPGEDGGAPTAEAQQLVGGESSITRRSNRRQNRRNRGTGTVPEEFIPDDEVVIGEEPTTGGGFPSVPARPGSGLVIGSGGGVGFVGRQPRPERTLTRARDSFFSVELTQPYESSEVRESAETSNVDAGSRPTPATSSGVDPLTGTRSPADTASDAATDAVSDTAQTPDAAQATGSMTGMQIGEGLAVSPAAVNAVEESAAAEETVVEQGPTETNRARTRPDLPGIDPESGDDDEEEFVTETQAGTILTNFVDPLTGEPTSIDDDPAGADGDAQLPGFLR